MERAKLKLTVILLLAVLNAFLLGLVLNQNAQAQAYQAEAREQAMVYLSRHGIAVEEDGIPWDSVFQDTKADPRTLLLDATQVPGETSVSSWEIRSMRRPETLVVDFVRGLKDQGRDCTRIMAIREGYRNQGQEDRVVLTPMWQMETDTGTYYLNCATGELN